MVAVNLPWPPSVNRLWRYKGKQVYRDPKYVAWIREAGWVIKSQKLKKISGPFRAEIVLTPPDKRKRDLDNIIKATLDLFQTMEIIENDQLCHHLIVRYDFAATSGSCCVTLSSMSD